MRYCTLLNDGVRSEFAVQEERMRRACGAMYDAKIPRANVQQQWMLTALDSVLDGGRALCAGCHCDTAYHTILHEGADVVGIDPVEGTGDLASFAADPANHEAFDVVFSTSVIEHVPDDIEFMRAAWKVLKPGGTLLITADFKSPAAPGDHIAGANLRFYDDRSMRGLLSALPGHELLSDQDYAGAMDFEFAGHAYAFATIGARKAKPATCRGLFLSYGHQNCGVWQAGRVWFEGLASGADWHYRDVMSPADIDRAVAEVKPDVTVYNWHTGTLRHIVFPTDVPRHSCMNIALIHELWPGQAKILARRYFHGYMVADPTFPDQVDFVKVLPRCIPALRPERAPMDSTVFGSFGFCTAVKGWGRLRDVIVPEYPGSTLRINIPDNWTAGLRGRHGLTAAAVRDIVGESLQLTITHDFMGHQELVNWLGEHTANILPYEPNPDCGISSSLDWAIAAGRPFAVSKSGLFKHVHDLPVVLGERSLRDILQDGTKWVEMLQDRWSPQNFNKAFHKTIEEFHSL